MPNRDHDLEHLPVAMSDHLGLSRSEARRLIDQGAVKINGVQVQPGEHDIKKGSLDNAELSIGKTLVKKVSNQ